MTFSALASLLLIGSAAPAAVDSSAMLPVHGEQSDSALERANLRVVLNFYDQLINRKDFDAARKFIGARYVEHDVMSPPGVEGLRAFVEDILRKNYPQQRNVVKLAMTDGDYVTLYVHSLRYPGKPGRALVEIFKVEEGGVVEHWDVVHPTPVPDDMLDKIF